MLETFFRIGDDSPYPLELPIGSKERQFGKWELGEGTYRAYQIGPIVEVVAVCRLSYFNSEARLFSSPVAVFPPQFGFYVFKPEVGLPAEREETAKASFISAQRIAAIMVWDRNGRHDIAVTQSPM